MADCDQLATTSTYFDGELAGSDEAAAARHLATCAACQQLSGTAVGLDAALADSRPLPIAAHTRTRTRIVVASVAAMAAAAVAFWVIRPPRDPAPGAPIAMAIALPRERVVEARFTGTRFAPHRAYHAVRGDHARESISLASLAELERRGERHDLVAALAASGELTRATELATALPADAAGEADRAAVALAARQPERALEYAYRALERDPKLLPAWWNLGLAARELGLPRVGRDAFERIVTHGEPGWTDEARRHVATFDDDIRRLEADFAAFSQRATAMLAGGAPVSIEDARRYPAFARVHFFDAVRLATAAELAALRPLAAELDLASGLPTATAAIDRIAPADLPVRAAFAPRYREVLARTASADQIRALLAQLRAAGKPVADLWVGTVILGGQAGARIGELRAAIEPWGDPWFAMFVERERIRATWPGDDLRAEPALVAAVESCKGDAYALRCGQLALDLANLHAATGLDGDAEVRATLALERFRRAAAPAHSVTALAIVAEQHRLHGRAARARAELDEVVRTPTAECDAQRYARVGLAALALATGDWAGVRTALPPAAIPPACRMREDLLGVTLATDLARRTRDPRDLAIAQQWIATAHQSAARGHAGIAIVGAARIAPSDATAPEALRAWLVANPATQDPTIAGIRAWGIATLVADAGLAGDWPAVLTAAASERPDTARAECTLVASVDDDRLTLAAHGKRPPVGASRTVPSRALFDTPIVSPAIASVLTGCSSIAVIARPPLHGRADLLPRELPWFFAGDSPAPTSRVRAARSLEVIDARPPVTLDVAPLPAIRARAGFDVSLAGPEATPTRVLAALADATYAELHVHGIAAAGNAAATFLALSPDGDGRFALRADAVRATVLRGAPVVVLAACRASTVAPYLSQRWSLPDAFLAAGASAVIAVDVPIGDDAARRIFDELRRRIATGEPIAAAVAAIRATAPEPWVRRLMVFR